MRIGSLFTGYGGLDLAIAGEIAWYSDIDKASCVVLGAHFPNVPNLGDITKITWSDVPKIDVLTAGYPCQPFSQAGNRKGVDDERHLWPYVCTAIDALRPSLVFLENVRGHLTLGFGDVLADLSRIGYDARWTVVRASDAGAPHGRARIFIVAYPSRGTGREGTGWGVSEPSRAAGLAARDFASALADADGAAGPERDERETARRRVQHRDHVAGSRVRRDAVDWGKYEPTIRRWERTLDRPAPDPTIVGVNGRTRLNPVFVEWMMGLPEGWVTGHNLSSAQELKMLGNGVVPQQARFAIELLG